ncbi:MAG: class I SAM-dependent methyltransferase [Pseudomonadota bacterium]
MRPTLKTAALITLLSAAACSEQIGSLGNVSRSADAGEAPASTSKLTAPASDGPYELRPPNRDGIGKIYLGREISHVMGHLGAGWLERTAREQEERTDLLIDALPLDPDSVVADIGAGTGYFTFPVAERVPDGQVLAVDIQPEMLERIEDRKADREIRNVQTVLGTVMDPNLPEGGIDLIFIVDAYHEFSHPQEMGTAMARGLRSGGRLVLIEYRLEDPSVRIKRLHKMTEAQAKREMAAIGLDWVETKNFLPKQHFMVFQKP